jgi:hypothetical protein
MAHGFLQSFDDMLNSFLPEQDLRKKLFNGRSGYV